MSTDLLNINILLLKKMVGKDSLLLLNSNKLPYDLNRGCLIMFKPLKRIQYTYLLNIIYGTDKI